MNKLVCMGECVADFLPSSPGELTYTAKAGGAPTNVCTAAARLGAPAYYLGKLSNDVFGKFLLSEIKKYGIDTSLTVVDEKCLTGLVFVDLKKDGNREFYFYRDMPADAMLTPEEVPDGLFEKDDILHFCSVALTECPTKHAHEKAVLDARRAGAIVSFDVNARLHLWRDKEKLVDTCFEFIPYCDVIKVTDEELSMLTDTDDEILGVASLFSSAECAKLIFVTKGDKGAAAYDRQGACVSVAAKAFSVVDTTGAGDCFIGSILYKLLASEASLTISGIKNALDFAVSACAHVISKKGAMNAMPTLAEVENLLKL